MSICGRSIEDRFREIDTQTVSVIAVESGTYEVKSFVERSLTQLIGLHFQIGASRFVYAHSTKDISFPVLPPIFPNCLLSPCAAPLTAGPAEEVTLERPCEAFDCALEAVSFDLEAALEAIPWVEACLRGVWRPTSRVCRSIKRGVTADDIVNSALDLNST